MKSALLRNKTFITVVSLFGATSFYKVDDPLTLHANQNDQTLLQKIIRKSPEIESMVFRPNTFLQNCHLNSINTGISSRLNVIMKLTMQNRKEVFKLSDGGQIVLNFSEDRNDGDAGKTGSLAFA